MLMMMSIIVTNTKKKEKENEKSKKRRKNKNKKKNVGEQDHQEIVTFLIMLATYDKCVLRSYSAYDCSRVAPVSETKQTWTSKDHTQIQASRELCPQETLRDELRSNCTTGGLYPQSPERSLGESFTRDRRKTRRNFGDFLQMFSLQFPVKMAQETSRAILDMFHSTQNRALALLRLSGLGA